MGKSLGLNILRVKELKGFKAYMMCPVDVTLVQRQPLYVCITRNASVLQGGKKDCHAMSMRQKQQKNRVASC